METGNPSDSLSSSRSGWNVESLQHEAFRLLQEFQSAAARTGATEEERINAETAKIIVELAEMKAGLIDRRAADSKIDGLKKHGEHLIVSLGRDVVESLIESGKGSASASLVQLQREYLDKLQAKFKEVVTALDQHVWSDWNEACEELLALRAGRYITDEQGEV